jgi:hypothetical protein
MLSGVSLLAVSNVNNPVGLVSLPYVMWSAHFFDTHIQMEKISSWNGPTVHVCCFMLACASTKTFVSRVRKTKKKSSLAEVSLYIGRDWEKPRKTSLTGVPTDITGHLLNVSEALCQYFSYYLLSRDSRLYLAAKNDTTLACEVRGVIILRMLYYIYVSKNYFKQSHKFSFICNNMTSKTWRHVFSKLLVFTPVQ